MTDIRPDHSANRHRLLTLVLAAALAVFAGVSSTFHGDDASLTSIKILVSIPIAIGFVLAARAFGPGVTKGPLDADFFERNFSLATLLVTWVVLVLWTPGQHPFASIAAVIVGVGAYVFVQAMIALANRSLARRQ